MSETIRADWYKPKFVLVGDGKQAEKHRKAIENIGGQIVYVYDPIKNPTEGDGRPTTKRTLSKYLDMADWAVIVSPNYLHYQHTKFVLQHKGVQVIVEKPLNMPWEPTIDDDRVNVVLQFRYLNLPETADLVKISAVRNPDYFKTWKGNERMTGGIFYHLFVHYIDLAIMMGAKFEGQLLSEGEQERLILGESGITLRDLTKVDMQELYNTMYVRVVNDNQGIKPRDIFYLNWIMNKYSMKYEGGSPYRVSMDEWRMSLV